MSVDDGVAARGVAADADEAGLGAPVGHVDRALGQGAAIRIRRTVGDAIAVAAAVGGVGGVGGSIGVLPGLAGGGVGVAAIVVAAVGPRRRGRGRRGGGRDGVGVGGAGGGLVAHYAAGDRAQQAAQQGAFCPRVAGRHVGADHRARAAAQHRAHRAAAGLFALAGVVIVAVGALGGVVAGLIP